MKQMIRRRLTVVILTAMLCTLFLNYFLQLNNARSDMRHGSLVKFRQIEQILEQNESDTVNVREELKQDCFIRAKAAAYIVQNHPEVIGDLEEVKKIAGLLQVDELHFFDTEGNLFAGSEPKYYGLNFDSGDQMRFFLPILKDRSLELCQDVTPNTAEQKLMQYAAVWREDGQGIVQIGLEPTRVLESMKKNELSYIFSMVTAENGSSVYAVDPETFRILGATRDSSVGLNVEDIGLSASQIISKGSGFRAAVNGVDSYCVFARSGSVILGNVQTTDILYHDVNRSTLLVALYLFVTSMLMIFSITRYIDRYILDGISSINGKLIHITKGNLETKVEEKSTPEFAELSGQINLMVKSLLDNIGKLSQILEIARVPIGVYEYGEGMKRVMATSRVAEILKLSGAEAAGLLADNSLFEKRLEQIRRNPLDQEKGVYILPGKPERFVRLETYFMEHSILGMVVDVTDDISERRRIEQERDIDLLTGLFSRRAFYRYMDELFDQGQPEGRGLMIMADADNLKYVNDQYGHDNGDRYLKGIARVMSLVHYKNKVLARLSGDEFVLFLHSSPSRELLESLLDELYKAMDGELVELTTGERIPVRFSAGCAFYPEDGRDYRQLLKLADEAMYRVKKERKKQ